MKENRYHCCATCIHYRIKKQPRPLSYICARLGYKTKPTYQFNCWEPNKNVQNLLKNNRK
ncbi:hypothetical protein DS031_13765 [Bacillus taeanensis]|uniref:Uncharacterized protein n=1 Tax=Bacillus taeanensis TaxID=273032 RepID=A0A366XRL8_9BACI|nr:hypothetical protein [Bacillus taeanensis]RBW69000.1 hypothetical protein DS031_13765 [Bacillus taeanensis]